MPNYCGNRMRVFGPAKELARFGAAVCGVDDDREVFSLAQLFPVPDELKGIDCGGIHIDGVFYTNWRVVTDPVTNEKKSVGIGRDEADRLVAKYGAANALDWQVNHLGTKWGTFESDLEEHKDCLFYIYRTAWGPISDECLAAMSAMFPGLTFEMLYAERGMCFKGRAVARDGKVIAHDRDRLEDGDFDSSGNYLYDDEYAALVEISG